MKHVSNFARQIMNHIKKSKRGTDFTGKFRSLEELVQIFANSSETEIISGLRELTEAKYVRDIQDDNEFFSLTPLGEAYLEYPIHTPVASQQVSYIPNDLEYKILQYLNDRKSNGHFKETPAGVTRDITKKYTEYSKVDVESAIEILLDQKLLKNSVESFRYDPNVYSKLPKQKPTTVKTTYIKLTGKALLLLSNRVGEKTTAIYDSASPYDVRRKLETIFESAENEIIIADNYIGRKTLDYLGVAHANIKILTSSHKEGNFDAVLEDFRTQYKSNIEIKAVDNVLHGRFIIADSKYYLLDHSIKDFGSKPSTITEIVDPTVQDAFRKLFKDNWR